MLDGALHDPEPRGDDGLGLLPAKHVGRDLGRGQPAQLHPLDVHADLGHVACSSVMSTPITSSAFARRETQPSV